MKHKHRPASIIQICPEWLILNLHQVLFPSVIRGCSALASINSTPSICLVSPVCISWAASHGWLAEPEHNHPSVAFHDMRIHQPDLLFHMAGYLSQSKTTLQWLLMSCVFTNLALLLFSVPKFAIIINRRQHGWEVNVTLILTYWHSRIKP